ncbi:hypothetical protein [Fodinicola acaciae]|uniref:hypothetical protein n=1 Tax=Fodinicola acaciae TaxID=2681555 RepID=UPI0013D35530|nr:hypothetical protein [Fodinicola acaciae]
MDSESGVWEMTFEKARVPVRGSSLFHDAQLMFSVAPPWQLEVWLDDGTVVAAQENDLFECLVVVRRQLELRGISLCCEGARSDVFPSGMARQMGGGRKAYRHFAAGEQRPQLVDIFASTDCSKICRVDEQLESVRKLRHG